MKKLRDLAIICAIYLIAVGAGIAACFAVPGTMLKFFVFDLTATVVTFIFSLALHNSSVYDPYWSLVPMVMSVWLFVAARAFSPWQLLFLAAFNVWGFRLTANWVIVFTDFSYEDWRYRMFREQNGPFMWFIINFFGIHLVPTLVVFAGMLPLFEIACNPLGALALPGIALILCGVALEFFADRDMHAFLNDAQKTGVRTVCRRGLWKYSRHPNYLGEITVWCGVFLAMIPYAWDKWYFVVGPAAMMLLFNVVSVPMMEKRQLSRRPEYADYRRETSRLLLLPQRKSK